MENIILDTCVFFKMIRYNDFYDKYGAKLTKQLVERDKINAEKVKSKILVDAPEEFFKKHGNLPQDEQIEMYKDFATNKMANLKNVIQNKIKAIVGYHKDDKQHEVSEEKANHIAQKFEEVKSKLGFLKQDDFSEMMKDFGDFYKDPSLLDYHPKDENKIKALYEQIDKAYEEYSLIEQNYKQYLQNKEDYKTAVDIYEAGELYLKAQNGEYSLFVVSAGYDEILNHTEGLNVEDKSDDFLTFKKDQIVALTRKCNLISIKNHSIAALIDQIASYLRSTIPNSNTTPMSNDKNSLKVYGDSTIEASSLLCGYILVTQNYKDFVEDKSIKTPNQNKREHIKKISEINGGLLSDALPYSVSELLAGDAKQPLKQSQVVKLVEIENKQSEFLSEYEIQSI